MVVFNAALGEAASTVAHPAAHVLITAFVFMARMGATILVLVPTKLGMMERVLAFARRAC